MEVKLMGMNAGDDSTSYTNNSGLQKIVISKTWCVLDETLKDMCINGLPKRIRMADLGCGPGPNTFLVVSHIMDTIKRLCKHEKFEVFLDDLPGNDFNNLFKFVNERKELLDTCFIYGAPGSFYAIMQTSFQPKLYTLFTHPIVFIGSLRFLKGLGRKTRKIYT
ncbi:hypothetical protein ACS0TY_019797 [Phlomoides rotata]